MENKVCPICGVNFKTKDKMQKYCSIKCGRVNSAEKQRKYYPCQHCGAMFWKPNAFRKKYCSKECQQAAYKISRPLKEKKANKLPVQYKKQCLWCENDFVTSYPNKKYCSKDCTYNGNLRDKREQWANEYVPKIIKCKECGYEYKTECGDKHSVFCCKECADKNKRRQEHQTYRHKEYMKKAKKKREYQLKNQFVEDVLYEEIYTRDKGICQICGLPVHPLKRIDNNWDGTIDHIIPVSLGGVHSIENCQLAHRICNSIKGTESNKNINWLEKSKENKYWEAKYVAYEKLNCDASPGQNPCD